MELISPHYQETLDNLSEQLRIGRLVTGDTVEFEPVEEPWQRVNMGYIPPPAPQLSLELDEDEE